MTSTHMQHWLKMPENFLCGGCGWSNEMLLQYNKIGYRVKGRVVTIQLECARFNVGSNMLVCVVSRYIVWCIIYLVILLT